MGVSALTNSFYVYTPVVQSAQQQNSSSVEKSSNTQNSDTQYNIQQNNSQNNNVSQNSNINSSSNGSNNETTQYYGLTGEEILASRPDKKSSTSNQGLSESEQKQVDELKARDREVKTHEQAHIAAGGSYVQGGANYEYQTGPDGKQYAVGGNVSIDTSAVEGDPQATINKAQTIVKAALAPAEPSSQDKAVANQARQMMNEARKELMQENQNSSDKSKNIEKSSSEKNNNDNVENNSKSSSSSSKSFSSYNSNGYTESNATKMTNPENTTTANLNNIFSQTA